MLRCGYAIFLITDRILKSWELWKPSADVTRYFICLSLYSVHKNETPPLYNKRDRTRKIEGPGASKHYRCRGAPY